MFLSAGSPPTSRSCGLLAAQPALDFQVIAEAKKVTASKSGDTFLEFDDVVLESTNNLVAYIEPVSGGAFKQDATLTVSFFHKQGDDATQVGEDLTTLSWNRPRMSLVGTMKRYSPPHEDRSPSPRPPARQRIQGHCHPDPAKETGLKSSSGIRFSAVLSLIVDLSLERYPQRHRLCAFRHNIDVSPASPFAPRFHAK
jgi:hypothetical protein